MRGMQTNNYDLRSSLVENLLGTTKWKVPTSRRHFSEAFGPPEFRQIVGFRAVIYRDPVQMSFFFSPLSPSAWQSLTAAYDRGVRFVARAESNF